MNKNQIPVGPFHPLLEEAEYFNLTVEGETVVDIDMDIGWMHRGHEFISEQKTFTQSIFLVERICGNEEETAVNVQRARRRGPDPSTAWPRRTAQRSHSTGKWIHNDHIECRVPAL